MKKIIIKSIVSGLFFISTIFIFGIIYLKVRAAVSTASPGSPLSASNRNELLTQVFQKNGNNLYYNTGNIGIGTSDTDVTLDINGYTQLGSDAPKIKMKKFTGTTSGSEGGNTTILHGIIGDKIISATCIVRQLTNYGVINEFSRYPGYQYSFSYDNAYFHISNHPTNSENILSKPYVVTIFYEE